MMRTQLLISVRNSQEALTALSAGADIIDLKDPAVGALGALSVATMQAIALTIKASSTATPSVTISATVGENHLSINHLIEVTMQTASLGIDVIKIALNTKLIGGLLADTDFLNATNMLRKQHKKLIGVMFAEQAIDFNTLCKVKNLGFDGLMLDTAEKNGQNLLDYQSLEDLATFVQFCTKNHLICGLAGSLSQDLVEKLSHLNPNYVGLRGGVCCDLNRQAELDSNKIIEIKNMLLKHHKLSDKAH